MLHLGCVFQINWKRWLGWLEVLVIIQFCGWLYLHKLIRCFFFHFEKCDIPWIYIYITQSSSNVVMEILFQLLESSHRGLHFVQRNYESLHSTQLVLPFSIIGFASKWGQFLKYMVFFPEATIWVENVGACRIISLSQRRLVEITLSKLPRCSWGFHCQNLFFMIRPVPFVRIILGDLDYLPALFRCRQNASTIPHHSHSWKGAFRHTGRFLVFKLQTMIFTISGYVGIRFLWNSQKHHITYWFK